MGMRKRRVLVVVGAALSLLPDGVRAREIVGSDVCDRLVQHRTADEVGHTPDPDVSADGNATLRLPDEITIPITVDVPRHDGGNAIVRGEAGIGTITVAVRDGQIVFNGEPVARIDRATFVEACRKMRR